MLKPERSLGVGEARERGAAPRHLLAEGVVEAEAHPVRPRADPHTAPGARARRRGAHCQTAIATTMPAAIRPPASSGRCATQAIPIVVRVKGIEITSAIMKPANPTTVSRKGKTLASHASRDGINARPISIMMKPTLGM